MPNQAVPAGYDNAVYYEVSYNHALPNWSTNGNLPLTASGNPGTWKSEGFTTRTGDWSAYIETEGFGGKFMVMNQDRCSAFTAANPSGYACGSFAFTYACGGQSGAAATEIECELKLSSGSYYLVCINVTGAWAGGAANIQFHKPN